MMADTTSGASETESPSAAVPAADEASPERVRRRGRVADALADHGEFGSVYVLSHEGAERVLTPKRREILRTLGARDVSSQRELARLLERDAGAVQRDLERLIDAGVVAIEQDGQSKKPVLAHDTVVIEPLVAPEVDGNSTFEIEDEP